MSETIDRDLSRLRWRCRRGMKELDILMNRYLDQRWASASAEEKVVFEDLLKVQDPDLYSWFIGRGRSPRDDLHGMVELILALPVTPAKS